MTTGAFPTAELLTLVRDAVHHSGGWFLPAHMGEEDVVQDTMLHLFAHRERLQRVDSVTAYVRAVVRNRGRRLYCSRVAEQARLSHAAPLIEPVPSLDEVPPDELIAATQEVIEYACTCDTP